MEHSGSTIGQCYSTLRALECFREFQEGHIESFSDRASLISLTLRGALARADFDSKRQGQGSIANKTRYTSDYPHPRKKKEAGSILKTLPNYRATPAAANWEAREGERRAQHCKAREYGTA